MPVTKRSPLKKKMSRKDKEPDQVIDSLIRVEIYRKNDKPFDGRLSREDLKKVWCEALRKNFSDVDGMAAIQIRGL